METYCVWCIAIDKLSQLMLQPIPVRHILVHRFMHNRYLIIHICNINYASVITNKAYGVGHGYTSLPVRVYIISQNTHSLMSLNYLINYGGVICI